MAAEEKREELDCIQTEWLKSAPTPIFMLDNKGKISYCNDTFVELTGYDRGGLLGARMDSLFGQNNIASFLEDMLHLYKGDRLTKREYDLLRQSGSQMHIIMDMTPVFGAENEGELVTRVFGLIRSFEPIKK